MTFPITMHGTINREPRLRHIDHPGRLTPYPEEPSIEEEHAMRSGLRCEPSLALTYRSMQPQRRTVTTFPILVTPQHFDLEFGEWTRVRAAMYDVVALDHLAETVFDRLRVGDIVTVLGNLIPPPRGASPSNAGVVSGIELHAMDIAVSVRCHDVHVIRGADRRRSSAGSEVRTGPRADVPHTARVTPPGACLSANITAAGGPDPTPPATR